MTAPERIWAASVTENYGEWQTTTDGLPSPTEYVRADLVTARCSSCDGTGDVHRADGEWLGECDCGSEFRHTYDVEANPSKAFRVIQSQSSQLETQDVQIVQLIGENAALAADAIAARKAVADVASRKDYEYEAMKDDLTNIIATIHRITMEAPHSSKATAIIRDLCRNALERDERG